MGRDAGMADGWERHFAWLPVYIHEVVQVSAGRVRHERGMAWLTYVERRRELVSTVGGSPAIWLYRRVRARPG